MLIYAIIYIMYMIQTQMGNCITQINTVVYLSLKNINN